MTEDQPAASLVGIPRASGEDWRGHAFVPNTPLSLRGAVGVTLTFQLAWGHPHADDPEVMERYKRHTHDYQDAELVVNGETYPAVEVWDTDLGIRVRAARVNGHTVIAVVPANLEVPGVDVTWPVT